jgi:hypothetical protein
VVSGVGRLREQARNACGGVLGIGDDDEIDAHEALSAAGARMFQRLV